MIYAHSSLHRLIPARAGSTRHQAHQKSQSTAHPRSRGEHSWSFPSCLSCFGSSPLVRGTCHACSLRHSGGRLIPARAGEHPVIRQLGSGRYGSSPLARGTQAEHCPAQISSPLYSTALIGTEAPTLEGPYRTPYPYPYQRAKTYGTAQHQ